MLKYNAKNGQIFAKIRKNPFFTNFIIPPPFRCDNFVVKASALFIIKT